MARDRANVRLGNIMHLVQLEDFPTGLIPILPRHIAIGQNELVRILATVLLDMSLDLLNTVLAVDSAIELIDHAFAAMIQ